MPFCLFTQEFVPNVNKDTRFRERVYLMASIWKLDLSLLPEPDCAEQFERVGCFRDNQIVPRPIPDYIMTDRQRNLAIYSGQSIDWRNWDVYMPQFVCRCAKEAKQKGYTLFGVQFYGKQIKIQRLQLA